MFLASCPTYVSQSFCSNVWGTEASTWINIMLMNFFPQTNHILLWDCQSKSLRNSSHVRPNAYLQVSSPKVCHGHDVLRRVVGLEDLLTPSRALRGWGCEDEPKTSCFFCFRDFSAQKTKHLVVKEKTSYRKPNWDDSCSSDV